MSARIKIVLLSLVLLGLPVTAGAGTLIIVNTDGPGEGFNDPLPVTPVGGNTGTTLGAQRLIAFERAATIWGSTLASNVVILVQASFNPLSCDANSAVLGSAGTIQIISDFPNAGFPGTWYHTALANSLAGVDLITGAPGTNADDIRTQFNSSIDNNENCLAGTNWYLGLDHNEGTDIDLLAVLTHEFAHGLGHANFVNLSTGSFAGPPFQPDIYTIFSLDNSNGLHWDDMSDSQRAASAINTGNVVWDGANVTAEAPNVLGGRPVGIINTPPAIAGTIEVQTASFGPPLTLGGTTGDVVLAIDGIGDTNDGCEPFTNGGAVNGNIALVDRGSCNFTVKVKNAQDVGAIAVLVANNVATGLPPMGGADATIIIPSVGISQSDGNDIKNELPGVNVTLELDPTLLAGTDDNGLVRLYAPNPLEQGSSISHWDVVATPNLMLEPFVNADLTDDLDLSVEQMVDVGWGLENPADCNHNGTCDGTEDCNICPSDCISGGGGCGDGICEGSGEDCFSCPGDCRCAGGGGCNHCCGDGACSGSENSNNCPVDCDPGFVPPSGSCCGDGTCEGVEDSCNCQIDCGGTCPTCGDTNCDPGEDECNCEVDCGAPPLNEVQNSTCDDGEDNDCDGDTDCDDADCTAPPGDPACVCGGNGAPCPNGDIDCCSNKCRNGTCRGN